MRCNRRLFAKVKSFVLLTTVLTSLIIVITFVNRRPGILHGMQYENLVNYKYNANTRRPGAFLADYKLNNESYCTFKYHLPLKFQYEESDLEFSPALEAKSPYRVLYNVLEAQQQNTLSNNQKVFQYNEGNFTTPNTVTYATHVTPEFVNYISEIARAWDGAVSVAAFVPDDDADLITRALVHVCRCLPEMARVSVHYVFPVAHPPYVKANRDGELLLEAAKCELAEEAPDTVTYRTGKRLAYPVNLARNVARSAANTQHILVSDVELIPSERMAEHFLHMLKRYAGSKRLNFPSRVFVVPVFEIEKYEEIPRTKKQLLKLIREEKALYFHRHICSHCQRFPGLENWLQQDGSNQEIKQMPFQPFMAVKREYPYHRWEPIYIGTKDEPFYSESLSWEGKQDKMTQMLEMCLKGYLFLIMDNAFLIHWPGVKRKSNALRMSNKWRSPYLMKNTRQYKNIINNLAHKYRRNPRCKVQ